MQTIRFLAEIVGGVIFVVVAAILELDKEWVTISFFLGMIWAGQELNQKG